MKRIFWITLCLTAFVISTNAQRSVEVLGGINLANLSDPGNLVPGAVWKTRLGFGGGVLADFLLTDKLLFTSGVTYIQRGTKSEWWLPSTGEVKATVTNSYLVVPVHIKYEILDFGSRVFVIGGSSIGYLLSSRTEGTFQLYGNTSADTKDDYKSYDVSLDLGLNTRIPLSEDIGFVVAGNYSYGIIKVGQKGSNEQTRDFRISVGASYSIR